MTDIDIKALREAAEADRAATERFVADGSRETFDAAMLAREAYLGAIPSTTLLALLDRLERAERHPARRAHLGALAMTLDVKAHLRALHEAATPGPWTSTERNYGHAVAVVGSGWRVALCDTQRPDRNAADAALIVAAVNAMPALLDRLERAEAKADAGLALRRRMWLGAGTGVTRDCPADALRVYDSTCAALDAEVSR